MRKPPPLNPQQGDFSLFLFFFFSDLSERKKRPPPPGGGKCLKFPRRAKGSSGSVGSEILLSPLLFSFLPSCLVARMREKEKERKKERGKSDAVYYSGKKRIAGYHAIHILIMSCAVHAKDPSHPFAPPLPPRSIADVVYLRRRATRIAPTRARYLLVMRETRGGHPVTEPFRRRALFFWKCSGPVFR